MKLEAWAVGLTAGSREVPGRIGVILKKNSDIHNINTRNKSKLHQPLANLSTYQKGAFIKD